MPDGSDPHLIVVSKAYRRDSLGFYVNKDSVRHTEVDSMTALLANDYKLGLIRHDSKTDELYKLLKRPRTKSKIFLQHNTVGMLKNLKNKRVDGVILHSAEIDYLRGKNKNNPLIKDIVLVPHLSFSTPSHIILGAASPLGKSFMDKIDDGIEVLKSNGTQNKLLKEYVPSHFVIQ